MRRALVLAGPILCFATAGATLRAAPGAGTLADPVRVDAFPFAVADDTTGRDAVIDTYACNAALDESGPEVVYELTTSEPGRLSVWVVGDLAGTTDIDVHLLSSGVVSGGQAVDCLARSNLAVEVDQLPAGTYYVVVDTYVSGGAPLPGPYELRVDFLGYDQWRDRPVARGVTWRQRLYPDLFGAVQTVNVLVVDPTDSDLSFLPVDGAGCETVGAMGARVGAVAAVNAGFFDGSCNPVGLLKIDGQLVAPNPLYRSVFGVDDAGGPQMDWVDPGQDWPAAHQAIGGLPRLATGGAMDLAWEAEGAGQSFTFSRHPRTTACIDGAGRVQLVTFDGRTDAGGGVALDDLATWLLGEGCVDAMNYDGGGSTTMWIAGQPFGGVVSYPSDNGVADHLGSRAVANAWAILAAPFAHPPRFTTTPPLTAAEGVPWAYDADALDLDLYEALTFGIAEGPPGLAVDPATGEATFTPGYRDAGLREIALTVTDGEHLVEQRFVLEVSVPDRDGDGLPDTWETEQGTDPDVPDAEADPDGDGFTNAEEFAWGSDPLDSSDPGSPPGPDGGAPGSDAGDATGLFPGDATGGCGCAAGPGRPSAGGAGGGLPWLLVLACLLARLAPRRQGC